MPNHQPILTNSINSPKKSGQIQELRHSLADCYQSQLAIVQLGTFNQIIVTCDQRKSKIDFKVTKDDNNFSLETGQLKEIIKRPEIPWHLCP